MFQHRTFWIVAVGGVFVVLLLLVNHKSDRVPHSKAEQTLHTIRYCEWLQSDSYLTPSNMSSYIRSNEMAGLSLGQIFFAIQAYPQYVPEKEDISSNANIPTIVKASVMKDAWGQPLNFMWHEDAVKNNVCNALLKKNYPVLVWSSGPNGTNEFGDGDDVFVGK
jgi:hypothetical protein